MSSMESFEIDVKGATVSGSLRLPEGSDNPVPAVLFCRGLHVEGEDAGGLFDDLIDGLVGAGLAAVRFEHRSAELILEDFDQHSLIDELDDAHAVYQRLFADSRLDGQHLGVIGFGLGAIAAIGLARLNPAIDRLCLMAPTTAEHLRSRLTSNNGSPAALDPSRIPKAYMAALETADTPREAANHHRPMLIVHGAADRFIDQEVSLHYLHALESVGRDVSRILVARADHGFTAPAHRAACISAVTRFFSAMVDQPTTADLR